jgi:hypothetical protein
VVRYGFLLHFDTDNCLLKKFHYIFLIIGVVNWLPKHQGLLYNIHTAVQKNRVHFKNQAIKFSSIFCFVNMDFDIIFVNRL